MPHSLIVNHLAHITEAEITFGDLTVFVGPQAGGKSLLAQLWKLHLDSGFIQSRLRTFGHVWRVWSDFLRLYFGRGYEGIWQGTYVEVDGQPVVPDKILSTYRGIIPNERVFYIPARRELSLVYGRGWPLPFGGFDDGTPYVLCQYSEEMRLFLDKKFPGPDSIIFPAKYWLPQYLQEQLAASVYPGVVLRVDVARQRRLILEIQKKRTRLPIDSWTAGQREFTPLLLAFDYLFSLKKSPGQRYEWIVIEEPERSLHPQAIVGVIQSLLHLLCMGYKVVLMTHSPIVVEWAWLMQRLKTVPLKIGQEALLEYLGISQVSQTAKIIAEGLKKEIRILFFRRGDTEATVVDISFPTAWDANPDIAEWGGLATPTERARRILSRALSTKVPRLKGSGRLL